LLQIIFIEALFPAHLYFIILNRIFTTAPASPNVNEGKWMFSLYGTDIIKATYTPLNYQRKEQISNAVIAKPSRTTVTDLMVQNNGTSIHFRTIPQQLTLLNSFR
jgi:hypothetical protein